jgi:hypothetical protein
MSIQEWNKTLNLTWGGLISTLAFIISCTFYVTREVAKTDQYDIEIGKIQTELKDVERKMKTRDDHVRTEMELNFEIIEVRLHNLEK